MNHLSIRDIFRTLFYCCFLSNSGKEVVNSINFPSRRKNRKADLVTCFESRTATPPLGSARVFRGIFCPIGYGSEGFKRSASPAAYRFSAEKTPFSVKKRLKTPFFIKTSVSFPQYVPAVEYTGLPRIRRCVPFGEHGRFDSGTTRHAEIFEAANGKYSSASPPIFTIRCLILPPVAENVTLPQKATALRRKKSRVYSSVD